MLNLSKQDVFLIRSMLKTGEVIIWAVKSSLSKDKDMKKKLQRIQFLLWVSCFIFFINDSFFCVFLMIVAVYFVNGLSRNQDAVYVITNCKAIVWSGCSTKNEDFFFYYPAQLKNLEVQQNINGTGNIVFATKSYRNRGKHKIESSFMNIEDVNRVGALLERLAKSGSIIY